MSDAIPASSRKWLAAILGSLAFALMLATLGSMESPATTASRAAAPERRIFASGFERQTAGAATPHRH
jgi:hypothetical protein